MSLRLEAGLPVEILRNILKEACSVPEAFEYHVVDPEVHEMRVVQLIKDSMVTKCSLSLVSRLFHDLSEEHLYDIIQIRSFHHIRPLVNLLRLPCGTTTVTKGWFCRRLEIDMILKGNKWSWGRISLWGLLTSCPRLVDLRCSMISGGEGSIRDEVPVYPISLPLAQLLANNFGTSLRHLQFGRSMILSARLAIPLLSHMVALEVCRLSNFYPVSDVELERGISLSGKEAEAGNSWETGDLEEEEQDDEDEPEIPRLPLACPDDNENEEYLDLALHSSWPTTKPYIELPHLRDLRLAPLLSLVNEWRLPCLQAVTDTFFEWDWHRHDHIHALHRGLQSHRQTVIQMTFKSGAQTYVWELIGSLPSLQHVRFTTMSGFVGTTLIEPHACLRTITLFRKRSDLDGSAVALDTIFVNVEQGKLPSLSVINVWGTDDEVSLGQERQKICELKQLTLDVRDIKWSTWSE